MHNLIGFCLFLFGCAAINAQEFNCDVTINAEQTGNTQLSVFKTLETALEEFINKSVWTDVEYLPQERIKCSFFINVAAIDNSLFTATIQVQASRPVYNSGYTSPIVNFNDTDFNFEYLEYEPLVYNPNADQGNLIAVITYYLYTILGAEADTFEENGGTKYYKQAKQIVNIAQATQSTGWQASSGVNSRFRYNDDILSGIFKDYRKAMYTYHLKGLDVMESDAKSAKKEILNVIKVLEKTNNERKNTFVMRAFFDAKYNELARILSGGPKENVAEVIETLKNISPSYVQDWTAITQ